MGCGCNQSKDSNAGKTAAQLNDPSGTWTVRAPSGEVTRFVDYGDARRYAKRVGSSVTQ